MALQAAIVLVIGTLLFVAPSTADSLWPWPLTPLTSRAVGAWLLALTAGLVVTIWERDWERIRVAVLTYVAGPTLQFVALARFSDTVNWDTAGIWVYVAFLVSIFVLGLHGVRRTFAAEERSEVTSTRSPTTASS
jgi:hypothetical protein